MEKQKNRKPLVVGVIAAVVVLAVLLALVLTQCVGGASNATTAPATEDTAAVVPTYELYWNIDRAEYDGKSEAGMSSRMPEEDGYFHVRFFTEGEEITLKVADRKLINSIDVQDIMGLEFDDNGIVIGVLNLNDMPLEKLAWKFFVQSSAKGIIKANSSETFMGMPLMMEDLNPDRVWDMSGRSGPIGTVAEPVQFDRIYAIANLAGEVTHVFIFERPYYMNSHMAMCEHCKEEVEWKEWIRSDAFPAVGGHYQLNTDIQLTGQVSMAADTKMCLDLNGHRIDGKENARAISMHNSGITFAVMDSSEKQTGVIACRGSVGQGGCVWVRFGVFYLYGGTLDASKAYSELYAPALECEKDCFAYMNGGKIIGGEARYLYNAEKNSYSRGLGGALRIGGKFVLNDGIIEGGEAQSAVVYDAKGTPVYKCGTGGNIFLQTGSVFEMNGGIIRNGRSGGGGANIYADGTAEIIMNGGSIQGGVTTGRSKSGGSIYLGSKATMTMNGGTITGGVCYNGGGNIFVGGTFIMNGGYIGGGACYTYGTGKRNTGSTSDNITVVNATMIMWGGRIDGGVSPIDTNATDNKQAAMYINGVAQITGSTDQKDLTISTGGSGVKVYVGTLYEGAKIGIHVTTGIFSEPTKEEYKKYFYSTLKGADVVYYEGRLGLGKVSCICGNSQGELVSEEHDLGCDGKVLMWTPWRSTSGIPTTSGNHYLLDNVTTKSQTLVKIGQDVKLDLNGKNITLQVGSGAADGFRLYRVDDGSKLAITDTTDKPGTLKTVMPGEDAVYNGKTVKTKAEKDEEGNVIKEAVYFTEEEMRQKWAAGNNGMLLWAPGGEITIHDGIIDGSNLTGSKDGMVIYLDHKTVTNEETGEKTTYKGKLNMYGGTVLCGYTTGNGNVNISKAGNVMNIYGGTITGGRSGKGGNICLTAGELNMYGGTVTKGVCDRSADEVDGGIGGNIVVDYGTTMNLYGGTISDGFVVAGKKGGGHGGNIKVLGTLNAYGGIISGGQTSSSGGNIAAIGSASKLLLDGVQILDGVAAHGGNVGLNVRAGLGLTITEATVISGGVAKKGNGGNVYINIFNQQGRGVTLPVTLNGTITGGSAAQSGGNIYVNNTIQTATATAEAKPQDILQLTMKGTVVSGGTAKNSADSNIYLYNAEADLDSIQVGGGMTVANSAVSLSGKPVIAADNGGLTFENSFKVEAVLAEGSQIYVSGGGFVTEKTDAKNLAYFHSLGEYPVLMAEDRVFIGNYSCLCGKETHTEGCVAAMTHLLEKEGKTYSADAKLPMKPLESFAQLKKGGYWYLTKDLTTATNVILPAGSSLVLDLNGHEINVTQQSFLLSTQGGSNHDVSVVITDSSDLGEGAIRLASANTTVNQGGILRLVNGEGTNKAFLLGGILDASGYQLTKVGGTAIYVDGQNTVQMYGGHVIGNAGDQLVNDGGAIRVVSGKMVMHDGTVSGGKAAGGGNIHVDATAAFEMHGGLITGGSTNGVGYGANLQVNGSFTMTGGTIDGGVYAKDQVTLSGKPVIGGDNGGLTVTKAIEVSGVLETGARIYTGRSGYITGTTEAGNEQAFISLDGYGSCFVDSKVYFGKYSCLCGKETHTAGCVAAMTHLLEKEGKAYSADAKIAMLPLTSFDQLQSGGNWYLHEDLTSATNVILPAGSSLVLDLNGNEINVTQQSFLLSTQGGSNHDVSVVITDSSDLGEGAIRLASANTTGNQGGIIRAVNGNGTNAAYLLGGTLDASGYQLDKVGGTAIYVDGKSNFYMYGGAIVGTAGEQLTTGGGAIRVLDGKFYLYDGTILGGKAAGGGNVWICGNGSLEMLGGSITGGSLNKADGLGANLLVEGTLTMRGGSIAGGVYITGSKSAITGNAVIDKTLTGSEYAAPAYSLQIAKDNSFNVSGLNGGKIYVTAEGMFGTEADENAKASVYSEMEGKSVSLYENALHVGLVYCACGGKAEGMEGHTCQNILWTDWEDPNALPKEAGNWRLTTDVTITSFVDINKAGWVMNLDLNGHSITNTLAAAKTGRVFQITQGTLSITDSSEEETGIIIGNNIYGDGGRGGTIRMGESSTGATLYIYGGTITHTAADAESATQANSPTHGGVIELKGTSSVVMYGGIIQGGKTTGVGGNVMMDNSSTFTMYGGTIQDGYSASGGGNVAVHSSATFTMYGGSILGGESGKNGGGFNVVESGKLMLVDGTVSGGKSVGSGANVNLDGANTTFTMSGGTVAGGVYVPNSKATISGDAIIDKSLTEAGKTVPAYSLKLTKGNTLDVTGLAGGNINVLAEGKFALNADENAKTSVHTEVAKTEVVLYEDALHMGLRYCVCGGKAQGMKDHTCQDITWLDWTETTSLPTSGNWRLTQPVNLEAEALYSGNTTVMNLDLNGQSITSKGRVFWVDKDAQLSITNTGAEDTAIVMGAYSGSGTRGGTILVGQTTISSGKLNIYGGTFTHISGTDSSKTVQHGGVLDIRCGSQVKFYSGTITGARTTHVGGNIIVDNTATMTMYGGTISNGYSPNDGGNVAVHGKSFTIYGGTITGGQGRNGGNINVVNGKALNIHGGTITGGTATGSGANVNMAGTNSVLTMTSGVIAGGVYVANSKSAISGNAVINKNLTESGKPVPAYGLKITEGNTINVEGFSGGIVYVLADEKFATNADRAAEEGFTGEVEGKIVALLDGELHMRPYYCTCGGKAQGMEGHTCQNVVWLDWTDGTSLPKVGGNWRLTTDVTITSFVDVNNTNWVLNLDLNGHNITNTVAAAKYGKVFQITQGTLSITDSSTEKTGIITGNNISGNSGRGGTIRMGESSTGATLYIYGGIFTHSSATADTITSANAPAHGGVIELVGTSTMVMYGGTIQGGGATGNGGNIMVDNKATVTMYGGTIIGGRAKNGGNMAVHTSAGFVVREGTITDGIATVSGPNVHVDALNVFKMYGGTVAGGVNVPGKADGTPNNNTVISGNAVINKALTGANATAPTYSLNLASGATINVEGFSGGEVYVTADGLFAINAVETYGFESEVEDRTVTRMDSNLIMRPYYCACGGKAQGMEGHSCQRLIWLDWTETTSLPTSGNWRLTQPVTLETEVTYDGSTTVVNLDLNGQSITSKGRVFWVDKDAQLSITNTGAEATAVVTGALVGSGNRGGTILVGYNNETSGKLNIYGGTFTHTSSTATAADSTNAVAQGGVMDIRKASVVNIYGGTFVGGKTTGNGGNIMLDNTAELHMYGGSILNGWALRGGNVAVHSSVGFTFHDGLISGGYAKNNNGGNISISGAAKMTMKGGQVKDGSGANLTSGTEICLTNGTLKIEGGTISNAASGSVSVAIGYMKNTNYSGTIEMTGGTIQSGNVYVFRGGTFKHTANAVLSGISILNHANDKLVKTEADGVTTYKAQAK